MRARHFELNQFHRGATILQVEREADEFKVGTAFAFEIRTL
jgi:hypothetical protein